ncbi:MAG: LysM peptidoglycan-binding domain-containing protein [Clostridia bacterium]|nr:LysM peptidoglycan-binding domain-containing protein [Clostridia bacterium]
MEFQGRICPRGASYYTWQAGDTAQSVAQANGTTVQALQVLNPDVNFATLPAGTEICLPSQSYTCISGRPYTVQAGDTFTSIADSLGITTYELAERNPGVAQDSIVVGQVLCIPFASSGNGSGSVDQPAEPDTPNLPTPSVPSRPGMPSTPPIVIIPTQPACPAGYTRSTVAAGDTYADLLIRHNVSYRAMRAANPRLSPGFLVAGASYCAPPHGTRETCTGLQPYTILAGETLDTLAADLRTTKGRLLALNPNLLPSDFTQGTIICIP